jgi:hypothetical protein
VGTLGVFTALGTLILVSGLGARIFARLFWDDSASVRLYGWHALDFLSTSDILLGVSPDRITAIISRLGLITLENFWLLLVMQTGAIGLAIFATGLGSALLYFWKRSTTLPRLALLVFVIIASGNNSLASKTSALSILFLLLYSEATRHASLQDNGRTFANLRGTRTAI